MDRRTVKTVVLTVLVIAALAGLWVGAQAIRQGDEPGKQALAYLDALVRLGKLPTGAQVEQMIAQAQQERTQEAEVKGTAKTK